MPRQPDPKSRTSRIKSAYYDKKMEVGEIASEFETTPGKVQRIIWVHENCDALRQYERTYRAKRYAKDEKYRKTHIKRVRRWQARATDQGASA